jgi:hypothetical protein
MEPDFTIVTTEIDNSFIRIANELFKNYKLILNKSEYLFTEIEFYYHHISLHPDMSVHEHNFPIGNWRAHSQGLDISLGCSEEYDGGILIRGIKKLNGELNQYTNGPQRVVWKIFEELGSTDFKSVSIGLKKQEFSLEREIFRTKRIGLGINAGEYSAKPYNFFCDRNNWSGCYSKSQMENYKSAEVLR